MAVKRRNHCCIPLWGYAEFVEAIGDPKHPEHADMLVWVGGSNDPLEFDVEAVNQGLKYLWPVGG